MNSNGKNNLYNYGNKNAYNPSFFWLRLWRDHCTFKCQFILVKGKGEGGRNICLFEGGGLHMDKWIALAMKIE